MPNNRVAARFRLLRLPSTGYRYPNLRRHRLGLTLDFLVLGTVTGQ
jgi:hypothetical protein